MSPPDTLLVDGHDLRGQAGVRITGDMNLGAPGCRRGEDKAIPRRRGRVGSPNLPLDQYAFSVFAIISGGTRGQKWARLHALAGILNGFANDGLVTLTRRLASSDDSGYDEFTAAGRFSQGLAMQTWNPVTGHTELQFVNLEGGWHRSSDNVFVIP